MGSKTNIGWTQATWNFLYGCRRVSSGCERCYAEQVVAAMPRKFEGKNKTSFEFYSGLTKDSTRGPRWTGLVKFHREHLAQPLQWKEPRRIFVNSLSDTFFETVPFEMIAAAFGVMASAPQHTFQVLTKRPERMIEFFEWLKDEAKICDRSENHLCVVYAEKYLGIIDTTDEYRNENHRYADKTNRAWTRGEWPVPNVWLGVSVEDQKSADARIPLLLKVPAAVRFLSCEPMLEAIDLKLPEPMLSHCPEVEEVGEVEACAGCPSGGPDCPGVFESRSGIHWVICGGESGENYRSMEQDWAISLKDQCVAAKVAFFFKQASGRKSGESPFLKENGAYYRWEQYPGDLAKPQWIGDVKKFHV